MQRCLAERLRRFVVVPADGTLGRWHEAHLLVAADVRRMLRMARMFRQLGVVAVRRGQPGPVGTVAIKHAVPHPRDLRALRERRHPKWQTSGGSMMSDASEYVPPKVWVAKPALGRFANINRPVSGATHEKELPVGRHPLQLYSLGTPNGVKVTVMLEELLALGHTGAEYDAWLIKIGEGDQFGSGFVAINPNSKIPALLDRSGPKPIRVFESGAILLYLAEKFGAFLPTEASARAECLSWLFFQMGSAPYLGGGFGHFYAYAPIKIEYAIDRFTMEAKRLLDVLDKRLADNQYPGGRRVYDCRYGKLALVRRSGEVRSVRGDRVPRGA